MSVEKTRTYLDTVPTQEALWWFIENVGTDDPARTELFFYLRERMRAVVIPTRTATAFCCMVGGGGTTWIQSLEVARYATLPDIELAARQDCAEAWECEVSDVHCLGLAEGDVDILCWEDINA